MTSFLIRLFIKDHENTSHPDVRSRYGILSGAVGIVGNFFLFVLKTVLGLISASVSITADAVNNLSDAASSLVTLIGFFVARKPADKEHPFGHARFEYLSGLGVSFLIFVIGFQLAKDSFAKILSPTETEFSLVIAIGLLASIFVKLWLAYFTRKIGRRINSASLMAAAADSRNDVISTSAVIVGALLSRFFDLPLDGYVGFAVALFILYSGFGIAKDTIKPLLGAPAEAELVKMVEEGILSYDPIVLGIHDLMVHDYGPGQCFASVHAEIDRCVDVMVAHDVLDNIERLFRDKHNIHLIIHYDPIVTDDCELNEAKAFVSKIVQEIDSGMTLHDFRMVKGASHTNLIFDLVMSAKQTLSEQEIRRLIDDRLRESGKAYFTVITFDAPHFTADA